MTSIIDYLKSKGQASDYASRAVLAKQKGITNYTGTAEQNIQLLQSLSGQASQTPFYPTPTGAPITNPPSILTPPKTFNPPATKGLFFEVDGKKLYSPSGNKYDAIPAEQAPGAVSGQGATGGATGATEPPKLGGDDFASYYAKLTGIPEVAKEKEEYEASKAAGQKAWEASQAAKTTLIDKSQKLFDDLWNSEDITVAKEDRAKAFGELQKIDAEYKQAENALREQIKGKGTVSWAAAGQLKILASGYDASRATYAANYAIANDKLTEAKDYAKQAYDAGINTLNAKIGLVEATLKHTTDLTATEKSEYETILSQAKTYLETKKEEADTATDTYLALSKLGVGGITPTQSVAEMIKISGPVVAKIAQDEIARKNRESNIVGTTGANYDTRLAQEISNVYSGRYGTGGAREKALEVLQKEFPNVKVADDLYVRIPDGYENSIKSDSGRFLSKEWFASNYAAKDIKKLNLDETMKAIEVYRSAGYTDQEILKKMQE